jgi:uncharacterized protein (DUF2252 family)
VAFRSLAGISRSSAPMMDTSTTTPEPSAPPRLSPDDRAAGGKAARAQAPRSSHAAWQPPAGRADPTALLLEQAKTRVPELVPIRHGRMMTSPFAFFRGAAYVMASDLAQTPRSGMRVRLCGDAHLSNFGGFASPERDLVFDVNDFDETLPGPWEWDVKRLAASIAIAGRERGFDDEERRRVLRATVRQYREQIRAFARMRSLDVWYARLDAGALLERFVSGVSARERKRFARTVAKGRGKDSARAFTKLAHTVEGVPRIVSDPPLLVPIEDLVGDAEARETEQEMRTLLRLYAGSLEDNRRELLARYEYAHVARKVVGVGSVGTRAWVILLIGRDNGDPLFLQCKEAQPSVLEPFAGPSEYDNEGRRVVEGQRAMQAASDIFLGWLRATGLDGRQRDFYVRQLWDWKTSAEVEAMVPRTMEAYGQMCAWTLARAHARSGDAIAIGAYLGGTDAFDRAVSDFAEAYADQNERDHEAFVSAVKRGALEARADL